ncbi:Endonuclease/exonuclease/phosphatase, partial [Earliella scabrosa]
LARKTAVKVASLNMNGFGNLRRDDDLNKWGKLYRMMNEHKIGILMLQETHLLDSQIDELHRIYPRKIRIFASSHPDRPSQKEGVAIVVNLRLVSTEGATRKVIVPGRALQLSIRCAGGEVRKLLCIYAPTSLGVQERCDFYKKLTEYYESHPAARPDLMAGDFNNIEDAADRLPVREPPDASVEELDTMKTAAGLMFLDGWRATHPTDRDYTFHTKNGGNPICSRLDRIYVTRTLFQLAYGWSISESGIRTDHRMVTVSLTSQHATMTGKGRPVFPMSVVKNQSLAKRMKSKGLAAIEEIKRLVDTGQRSEEHNPQTVFQQLKRDWMEMARAKEKQVIPKLLAEIAEKEAALKALQNSSTPGSNDRAKETEGLMSRIGELKQRRYKQLQQNARARHRVEGERPSKYWSKLHRPQVMRELIPGFERETQTQRGGNVEVERSSPKMAEMARNYHYKVQADDESVKPPDQREADIRSALNAIHVALTEEQADEMGEAISREECEMALKFSKSGSAPGLDGLPYELWKILHERYKEDSRVEGRAPLDVVGMMHLVFEDVRQHGVSARTSFSEGWMSPIYKKGELTKIANYRPITLLNTDYKLFSKILALRL